MKKLIPLVLILAYVSAEAQLLQELFAPPTPQEKEAVLSQWNSRDTSVYQWKVEDAYRTSGSEDSVEIVSHTVGNNLHYGGVRLPRNYTPAKSYPILISNHGGMNGIANFDNGLGAYSFGDYQDYFIVFPSFCGEQLSAANGQSYTSEGTKSEFDRDVDNALALVNGVIAHYAGAVKQNMMVFGGSRGGGVTYLMMARDTRIERAVVFYGGVDHLTLPGLQEDLEAGGGGPFYQTVKNYSAPYLAGNLSLTEARFALLQRSPIHFIERWPDNIQIHHGDADGAVTVKNSRHADSVLRANNLPLGEYNYVEYPGVAHQTTSEMTSARAQFFAAQPLPTAVVATTPQSPTPFALVPSETNNEYHLVFSGNGQAMLKVYSLKGQLLHEQFLGNAQGVMQATFKGSALAAGSYAIEVTSGGSVVGSAVMRIQ